MKIKKTDETVMLAGLLGGGQIAVLPIAQNAIEVSP